MKEERWQDVYESISYYVGELDTPDWWFNGCRIIPTGFRTHSRQMIEIFNNLLRDVPIPVKVNKSLNFIYILYLPWFELTWRIWKVLVTQLHPSLWPHGLWKPARPSACGFPGKNTEVIPSPGAFHPETKPVSCICYDISFGLLSHHYGAWKDLDYLGKWKDSESFPTKSECDLRHPLPGLCWKRGKICFPLLP